MACMWLKNAGGGSRKKPLPADMPPWPLGGDRGRSKDYLNHPLLQQLLDEYEGRYGFNKSGPLAIPCDEFLFKDIIQTLRDGTSSSSHVPLKKLDLGLSKDSMPLLQGFESKRRRSN